MVNPMEILPVLALAIFIVFIPVLVDAPPDLKCRGQRARRSTDDH